ncbi:hypothetical protein CspeluHIS016_0400190 [Cutaneotrichosporon spelunceum]|uniref:Uncharacterized protein n=1 Tax=Cutaneotrichosporon spelunceum TaxID=1672016 RepID=A0AAD3YBM0_9TREE|nr:hypothetical protein CspeluHIS016_0400190 [Cutaneotrichosporon spelunceum]
MSSAHPRPRSLSPHPLSLRSSPSPRSRSPSPSPPHSRTPLRPPPTSPAPTSPASDRSTARRLVARARALAALLGLRLRRLRKRESEGRGGGETRLASWVEGEGGELEQGKWEPSEPTEENVPGVGTGRRRREVYANQAGRYAEERAADARQSWEQYRASVDNYTRSLGLGHGTVTYSGSIHSSPDSSRGHGSLGRSFGHLRAHSSPDAWLHTHATYTYSSTHDHRAADDAAWQGDRVNHPVRHNGAPAHWVDMVDWVEVELTDRRPDAGRWDKETELFREVRRIEAVVA